MKTKKFYRVVYMKGNSCSNQYAHGNVKPYGTKWRVPCVVTEHGDYEIAGMPILLKSNIEYKKNGNEIIGC